jgi:dipeptidyl aminopeptidase/acylaminoacyl peptidase
VSRTLTIDELLETKGVFDVDLSADGRRVAFVVRPSSYPKGGAAEGRVWIGASDGEAGEATRGPGNDALPRWSRDGRKLAFASDRMHRGLLSLHLLDFTGEARPIGELAGSVEDIAWSADGSFVLVLAADPGSDRAGGQSATKIEAADAEDDDPTVTRPRETWRRLYRIDVRTGATIEVGPAGVNVWEFGWNGRGPVAAVISEDSSESAWYEAEVALIDIDARTHRVIHSPEWQLQSPAVSSDGRRVAFVEGLNSDRTVLAGTITVVDLDEERAIRVAPHLDVTVVRWLDDGRLAYAGVRGLETMCGRVSLDGTIDEAWSGPATLGTTHRIRAAFSTDGRTFAAAKEAPHEPPEACVLDGESGGWRALTSLNTALAGPTSWTTDRFTWKAEDDLDLEGILLVPEGQTEALPLVVIVHGGPTNAWTFNFSAGYMNLGTLLAGEGHAVLLPNPRGSSGRGQDFARLNLGDMGGGDLQDILAGVEALAAAGIVDSARVGITGGSYGGFMSTWAPTQTDAFAASIPFACTSNWLSFHNTTNIGRFDELFLASDPYDVSGGYVTRSPVMHTRNCTTPTLLLHGQLDLCTPVGQAQEFYQALVDAGCEAELVVYARGGHGWAEREYLVDSWNRVQGWFDRHLSRSTVAVGAQSEHVAT